MRFVKYLLFNNDYFLQVGVWMSVDILLPIVSGSHVFIEYAIQSFDHLLRERFVGAETGENLFFPNEVGDLFEEFAAAEGLGFRSNECAFLWSIGSGC